MKKMMFACTAAALLAVTGCSAKSGAVASAAARNEKIAVQKAENMRRVCDFVKTAGHYFIATVDGDQPRVRPFGTINIFDGKLYIQTGKVKNVFKQIGKNPKVELCAFQEKEGRWMRISGRLINDGRREAKESMLNAYPSLKKLYSADDENTQVLYFTDGEATIYSFSGDPVKLEF